MLGLRFSILPVHGYLYLVRIVCLQVEVFAMGRSLVQRSSTDCGVLLCVRSRNLKNKAALTRVGLLRQKISYFLTVNDNITFPRLEHSFMTVQSIQFFS